MNVIPTVLFSILLFPSLWGCSTEDKSAIPPEISKLKNLPVIPSEFVEDPTITEWLVLEMDGTLLGRFTWPKQKKIEVIKDNSLYTRESDREIGIQVVMRYRIRYQ